MGWAKNAARLEAPAAIQYQTCYNKPKCLDVNSMRYLHVYNYNSLIALVNSFFVRLRGGYTYANPLKSRIVHQI